MVGETRRWRRFLRPALGALVGAAVLVVVGQLYAQVGGSCLILCRPPVAAAYGAIMGVVLALR